MRCRKCGHGENDHMLGGRCIGVSPAWRAYQHRLIACDCAKFVKPTKESEPQTEMQDDELMTVEEVSAYLKIPVGTIYQWRTKKKKDAPRGVRVGRNVRFRRSEVEAYVQNLYNQLESEPQNNE
jgi:excisionase family DNA binding protein